LALLCAGVGLLAGIEPVAAIAAALGLVFVLLVLTDLTVGLAAFTFLTFVALVPNALGPAVSFLKVAGLLLALSWLATVVWGRENQRGFVASFPGLTYALVGFLLWTALSLIWAEAGGPALSAFARYSLNAILFVIVFSAVREKDDLLKVMGAFALGSTVASLFGLLTFSSDPTSADRLSGTLGNPNELAAVLVVGAIFGIGLTIALKDSPPIRLAAAVAAAICILSLCLTLSRTGIVAGLVAMLAAIALAGKRRGWVTFLVVVIVFAGFGYFTAFASQDARNRITDPGNGTGRTDLWQVGRRMVSAHPIIGVGAGNFQTVSVHYLLEPGLIKRTDFIIDTPKVPHNTYLGILAELGIVGLALFMTIVFACLSFAYKAARNFRARGDPKLEIMARTVLVALIGLLAADFFNSEEIQKSLWLLLGLCPALLAMSLRDDEAGRA
jgi:putative inorganic carbon (HCO3(-)) transporter